MTGQLEIFISWSGARSKALAAALAEWLPQVNPHFKPWMSDASLEAGQRWNRVLDAKLSKCHIGIICVTPENTDSPWMIFEAGAISKYSNRARVCPILYGMHPDQVEGPLAQFQSTVFERASIERLVAGFNAKLTDKQLDPKTLSANVAATWQKFESDLSMITKIQIEGASLHAVLAALRTHGMPNPSVGRMVCFSEGFESHWLYQAAYQLARRRLLVFGRKNRKLFDKQHASFFAELPARINSGLDFRCLVLDPTAPAATLSEAHEDEDFGDQLKRCIQQAVKVLSRCGLDPDMVCRAYSIHRPFALVVVDDAVLFAPIDFGASGHAQGLTNCGFQIIDADLALGQRLVRTFDEAWDSAQPVSRVL